MSNKLHLVMPMGGGGTRFGNKGFAVPKPLIMLQGHPFFYWAVQSIVNFTEVQDITFVVLQEHVNNFAIDAKIHEYYPSACIKVIPHVLEGAVLTCLEGISDIKDDLPVLFNDCDHAFTCSKFYKYCRIGDYSGIDGALLTFQSDSPAFSYVRFDTTGSVIGTIEKEVASSEAICGAYLFGNSEIFRKASEKYLTTCSYKEFFMSGVYNVLYNIGGKVITFPLDDHITFGTPDEYDLAVHDQRLRGLEG